MGAVGRIGQRTTFDRLRTSGRRVRHGPLAVTFLSEPAAAGPRVAYAIGRAVGGAVVRNRLRRRLRAVVAGLASGLAPGAYLVGVAPAASSMSTEEMSTAMRAAMTKATTPPARTLEAQGRTPLTSVRVT